MCTIINFRKKKSLDEEHVAPNIASPDHTTGRPPVITQSSPITKKFSGIDLSLSLQQQMKDFLRCNEEDDASTESITSIAMESLAVEDSTMESLTIGSLAMMSISTQENDYSTIYESLTTRILRVSNSQYGYCGHTGDVAIKMLVDDYPTSDVVSLLENEHRVAQHLAKCNSSRSALKIILKEGFHAIYLEWAEGTDLREWIRPVQCKEDTPQSTDDSISRIKEWVSSHKAVDTEQSAQNNGIGMNFETAVRLALEISKALEDIHDCGVVHNNLTLENIIVKKDKDSGSFTVKIIDFGMASIVENHNDGLNQGHCKQNDIVSLGFVFHELFTGKSPFQNECSSSSADQEKSKNARPWQPPLRHNFFSLLNSAVPVCISTLILKLMKKSGSDYFYHSISEVISELNTILNILGSTNDRDIGRLKFRKDKLYGRDSHLHILMDAFQRVCQPDGTSELVLVSGYSGTGKSMLVQHFMQKLGTSDAHVLLGKFDQFHQMLPLSALMAAFSAFFKKMAEEDNEDLRKMSTKIKEAVGPEISILEVLIPNLREFTGAPVADIVATGGVEAQNRLKYVFRLFVRAIASSSRPLVLCLDDLQWVDTASIDFITSLITDSENSYLLVIGMYRENEVNANHPLSIQLKNVEGKVAINRINLANFTKVHVNELISETLKMSPCATESLSDVVYRKTSGNALFVHQFMRTLCDEGLLTFSVDTKQWQWDKGSINSRNISGDVVGLMSRKVISFPEKVQSALKLMACLGPLSEDLVECLVVGKDVDKEDIKSIECFSICRDRHGLLQCLDFSVCEGLLDRTVSGYKFAHDQIQLAAYCLIPEDEKGMWHLQIGIQLWANKTVTEEKEIFIAVGQINKGVSFVKDKYQRIEIVSLNLHAGEKAISLGVYSMAASYFEVGINLLDEKCWEEDYDLSLKLYSSCAVAFYCTGEFEKMTRALDAIFTFARSFNDKLQAYFTQIRAFGSQNKIDDAIKIGLVVLANLGENFPTTFDKAAIGAEYSKTKEMFREHMDEYILGLCVSEDNNKSAAMKLLGILTLFSSITRSKYLPLFVFRMVQITLSHGLCDDSAFCFASFGLLLRGFFDDIEGAYKYGQIALRLLDRFELKDHTARIYLCVYSVSNIWVDRYQLSLEPLRCAHEAGMRCGDIQYASSCAYNYCVSSFQCGEHLEKVERSMKMYSDEMFEHKQKTFLGILLVYRQSVLNLMGRSNDPLRLTGEAMDQEQFLKDGLEHKNIIMILGIYDNCCWLAYFFGEYELASQMSEKCQAILDNMGPTRFSVANHAFVRGLLSLKLAHTTDQANWKLLADEAIKKMERWSQHAPSNFQHKLLLLQAEYAFLVARKDAAMLYDMAIKRAGENGFVQDQALAYELAGAFYLSEGNASKASQSYGQAHDAYLRWGAKSKADHLRLNYPF